MNDQQTHTHTPVLLRGSAVEDVSSTTLEQPQRGNKAGLKEGVYNEAEGEDSETAGLRIDGRSRHGKERERDAR